MYLPGHSRQELRRALRVPALSPGWQASFRAMLDQDDGAAGNAGLAATSPPPAWPGFRPLVVSRIDRESDSVVSVHLADPEGVALPAALPGQYLTLRLPTEPDAPPVLRNYSLSGPPGADGYRISVKREEYGAASGYIHTRLRAGDRLEVAAPRGTFTLRPGDSPVLLISAGVGATPVLAMLHALAADRSGREVWWLHGARSGSDHSFAAEARALVEGLPNAHRHICFSRPAPGDTGDDFQTDGAPVGVRPRGARAAAGRGRLHLRAAGVHGGGVGRARRPGARRPPHPHRALRRRPLSDARHRVRGAAAAPPAGGRIRRGPRSSPSPAATSR